MHSRQTVLFGMGCFWGVERLFSKQEGVISTSVGYAGGHLVDPSYESVCQGDTGHVEIVSVEFDENVISFEQLLILFWEHHDPTQGMRQGNDIGSQYRSAIYVDTEEALDHALLSRDHFQKRLHEEGHVQAITTELKINTHYYLAEEYHQKYLEKNPNGYCALSKSTVSYF
jgi:peptide-methionine (S)-S-oxide reductase